MSPLGNSGGLSVISAANASAVPGAFWTPPTQPSARAADAQDFGYGILGNEAAWTTTDFYALWEALRNAHPGYITRSTPGKDQSNTYDWWVYQFTPANYEKTMVITAAIHGGEVTSTLGLFRFLYHVCESWRTYPALSYLRNKVRLIVVPLANPWGVQTRLTKNSRGVNLVRNFSYNWASNPSDPASDDYRGTAAFSEAESGYIRDLLATYSSAPVYIDLHNLGAAVANVQVYTPSKFSYDDVALRETIRFVQPDLAEVVNIANDLGVSTNYAAYTHGMHAYLPEFPDGKFGAAQRDSAEMTAAVKWYGNLILQAGAIPAKPTVTSVQYPRSWFGFYSQTSQVIILNHTTESEIPEFRLTVRMPGMGLLLVHGEVVLQNASGAQTMVYATPQIWQDGSDFTWPDMQRHQNYVTMPNGTYTTLPFSCVGRVLFSNTVAVNPVEAQVRLNMKSDHYFVIANRYRVTATWIPSTAADALQIYSAVDRYGQGTNAMVKVYPT
jgi:predicted deacylase